MINIGVLGPKGTFCDLAFSKFMKQFDMKNVNINYFSTISKVSRNIEKNDFSVLPLENSLDGYVQETLDALLEKNCHIICDLVIPVDFAFVSFEKDIKNIKKLYVQFKAYGQCLDFINCHNFEIYQTNNNVESLERMIEDSNNTGAIIPIHLLENINDKINLKIEHIIDRENNYTRFVLVGSGREYLKDDLKCSLWICAKNDTPGTLSNALKIFQEHQINLTCIMSRPTKNELGTYNFYVEFMVENKKEKLDKIISDLEKEKAFEAKLLGVYSRI